MDELFEHLAVNDLAVDDPAPVLAEFDDADIVELALDLQALELTVENQQSPPFGFVANTSLSGGVGACANPSCRLGQSDQLARFAALYADKVLLRDPFSSYSEDSSPDMLRWRLAGDIAVLNKLRPLCEAALVGIAPSTRVLCEQHLAEAQAARADLTQRLDEAAETLFDQYEPQVDFRYVRATGFIEIRGPEELVPHGTVFMGPFTAKSAVSRGKVRPELREALLARKLIEPLLDDIILHDAYRDEYGYNYLTDNALDTVVIQAVNGPQIQPLSQRIVEGLSHAVPVLDDVDPETMLKVRRNEGEAFQVYRDALQKVLREADLSSADRIGEAMRDAIQPELHKMELAVRNAQRIAGESLRRDVGVSAGMIGIGLLLGLVQPAAAAIVAAMGGANLVKDAAKKVLEGSAENPSGIRDNSYYFLWRVIHERWQPSQIITRG